MKNRFDVDSSGRILEFSQGGCPWKEHMFTLENEMNIIGGAEQILYVIFPDEKGSWRVQGVPLASHSFDLRRALPEPWRGFRNAELDHISGVEGCVFVHASGFIGGHQNRDGALALARKALEFPQ